MDTIQPTYPELEVELTGTDGNAFALIGRVTRAIAAHAGADAAGTWQAEAMDAGSYDELLQLIMRTVEVA
jgi:hypothetical protein